MRLLYDVKNVADTPSNLTDGKKANVNRVMAVATDKLVALCAWLTSLNERGPPFYVVI